MSLQKMHQGQNNSSPIARSKDWSLYFDSNSNFYYWYNNVTNVSEWAQESEIGESLHSSNYTTATATATATTATTSSTSSSSLNNTNANLKTRPKGEHYMKSIGDNLIENFKLFPDRFSFTGSRSSRSGDEGEGGDEDDDNEMVPATAATSTSILSAIAKGGGSKTGKKSEINDKKYKLAGDFKSFLKDYDDGGMEINLETLSDWREDAGDEDNNYDADENFVEGQQRSLLSKESSSSSSTSPSPSSSSRRTKIIFACSVVIHSLLIEAPLCAAESIVRAFVVLAVGLLICMLRATGLISASDKDHQQMLAYFIEFLKCLAAALSFIIPGLILFVYKDILSLLCYCCLSSSSSASPSSSISGGDGIVIATAATDDDEEEVWNLRPIFTVAGWIDCRRYFTITSMNGLYAQNIATFKGAGGGKNKSQDSFSPNHLILFPKYIYKKIASILREKD